MKELLPKRDPATGRFLPGLPDFCGICSRNSDGNDPYECPDPDDPDSIEHEGMT